MTYELNVHDFQSSSPWAWDSLSLVAQIFVHRDYLSQLDAWSADVFATLAGRPHVGQKGKASAARIDIYTWHTALALEISSVLRMVLRIPPEDVRVEGVYYPKQNLQDVSIFATCDDPRGGALAQLFKSAIGTFVDDAALFGSETFLGRLVPDLEFEFSALHAENSPDVVVCTTPILFCHTLVKVLPADVNVIIYVDDLFDMVPVWMERDILERLVQVAWSETSNVYFLASAPFVAALVEYSWGLEIPAISRVAAYVPSMEHKGKDSRNVLIQRCDHFIDRRHGMLFFRFLFKFLSANVWIDLRFLSMMPRFTADIFGPEDLVDGEAVPSHFFTDLRDQEHGRAHLLTFDQMMMFTANSCFATLFFPDDLAKSSFYEAYAMGIPIFAPGRKYLSRLLVSMDYYHLLPRHQLSIVEPNPTKRFHFSPFQREQGQTALLQAYYWAGFLDFITYDFVERFESVPELLSGLLTLDVTRRSEEMRVQWAQRLERAVAVWSSAFKVGTH